MSEQATLFDVDSTTPKACPLGWCGSIRLPGQDKTVTCSYDHRVASEGFAQAGGRPRGCLNSYDPATAEIPF